MKMAPRGHFLFGADVPGCCSPRCFLPLRQSRSKPASRRRAPPRAFATSKAPRPRQLHHWLARNLLPPCMRCLCRPKLKHLRVAWGHHVVQGQAGALRLEFRRMQHSSAERVFLPFRNNRGRRTAEEEHRDRADRVVRGPAHRERVQCHPVSPTASVVRLIDEACPFAEPRSFRPSAVGAMAIESRDA